MQCCTRLVDLLVETRYVGSASSVLVIFIELENVSRLEILAGLLGVDSLKTYPKFKALCCEVNVIFWYLLSTWLVVWIDESLTRKH